MSMLKNDQWKPQTQMRAVFEAIVNLLLEPNPDDPLGASTPSVLYNLGLYPLYHTYLEYILIALFL